MAEIAENARAFASGGQDTAVDVTSVLKGVKRSKRLNLPTRKPAEDNLDGEDPDDAADAAAAALDAAGGGDDTETYVESHGDETLKDGSEEIDYCLWMRNRTIKDVAAPAAGAAVADCHLHRWELVLAGRRLIMILLQGLVVTM